uniref:Uncharacterized protein n=1 Tax=Plectus sambesii TaxID=2011161 RepID=A0A914WSX2_9BILA
MNAAQLLLLTVAACLLLSNQLTEGKSLLLNQYRLMRRRGYVNDYYREPADEILRQNNQPWRPKRKFYRFEQDWQ